MTSELRRFYPWTDFAFDWSDPANNPYYPFADAKNQRMARRCRAVYVDRIHRDVDKLEKSMAAKFDPGVWELIKEFADPEHFDLWLRLE